MAGHRPFTVWIFQTIQEEGRITYDGIKLLRRFIILQAAARYAHPVGEGTSRHILTSLITSLSIQVNTYHLSLLAALRHHQRDESCARTNIQYTLAARSPCPQQHTIRTHLHGTTVLVNFKLLKLKSCHLS